MPIYIKGVPVRITPVDGRFLVTIGRFVRFWAATSESAVAKVTQYFEERHGRQSAA
jgi:hypothetical protein